MRSHIKGRSIQLESPAGVLFHRYIVPSGKSIPQLATCLNVSRVQIDNVLKGGRMPSSFIFKLSKFTCTPQRYWEHLQNDWAYCTFLAKRGKKRVIPPITEKVESKGDIFELPGHILLQDFLKPNKISIRSISKHTGISTDILRGIIRGNQQISYISAGKIGAALGTGPRFWLDLQLCYEIYTVLKSETVSEKKHFTSFYDYYRSIYTQERRIKCISTTEKKINKSAGLVLLESFIRPSCILARSWAQFFCIDKTSFDSIIKGKSQMSASLIIKLSKQFRTKLEFWIDAQNSYLSFKAEMKLSQQRKKIDQIVLKSDSSNLGYPNVLGVLVNNFLKPMNIQISEFAKYIGVSRHLLHSLKRDRLDFELATRIGQALNMDPKYWLWLQIESDVRNCEYLGVAFRNLKTNLRPSRRSNLH